MGTRISSVYVDLGGFLTDILQGCFTGTEQPFSCPRSSEVTLKYMDKSTKYNAWAILQLALKWWSENVFCCNSPPDKVDEVILKAEIK